MDTVATATTTAAVQYNGNYDTTSQSHTTTYPPVFAGSRRTSGPEKGKHSISLSRSLSTVALKQHYDKTGLFDARKKTHTHIHTYIAARGGFLRLRAATLRIVFNLEV